MILGYVDSEDRMYDLNFATLRLRVRVEQPAPKERARVTFSQVAGAGVASYRVLDESDATAEASMDHDGKRVPLLRPAEGTLFAHKAGSWFFPKRPKRVPEDRGFSSSNCRPFRSAAGSFLRTHKGAGLIWFPGS